MRGENPQPEETQQESSYWVSWRNIEGIAEFSSLPLDEHAMVTAFLNGLKSSNLCEELLSWHSTDQVSLKAVKYLRLVSGQMSYSSVCGQLDEYILTS